MTDSTRLAADAREFAVRVIDEIRQNEQYRAEIREAITASGERKCAQRADHGRHRRHGDSPQQRPERNGCLPPLKVSHFRHPSGFSTGGPCPESNDSACDADHSGTGTAPPNGE